MKISLSILAAYTIVWLILGFILVVAYSDRPLRNRGDRFAEYLWNEFRVIYIIFLTMFVLLPIFLAWAIYDAVKYAKKQEMVEYTSTTETAQQYQVEPQQPYQIETNQYQVEPQQQYQIETNQYQVEPQQPYQIETNQYQVEPQQPYQIETNQYQYQQPPVPYGGLPNSRTLSLSNYQ